MTNGLAGSSAETVAGFTGNNVAVISMAPTANPPRNSDGNPDSLQAAVFLATIADVTVGL